LWESLKWPPPEIPHPASLKNHPIIFNEKCQEKRPIKRRFFVEKSDDVYLIYVEKE